jgi:hypothetical protein
MKMKRFLIYILIAALGTLIVAAEPKSAAAQKGVQVLTRGPVHEAFAETVTFDPEPGLVAPKAPPAAIEELPPDQKPEGANVAWIPGYWAWDEERSDFLWVSGIWRDLPPGRQWVPGYWGKTEKGFQWTSGYWADAKVTDVQYLSEPPATVEDGPNIAAPSADSTWLPGCWMWRDGRYAWRPGFWGTAQADWDWVPAHYVYSPRGYVFVDGYWDYSVGRRGVLFAPVYFDAGVYAQPGFSYSPTTVINPDVFATCLFLRPQYQHYYFGDYYDANYQTAGYYPSYSYNSGRYGYDPIYAHERWQHRQDGQWQQRVAADFQNRRDHEDARPPRTWAAQRDIAARASPSGEKGIVMAAPLDQLTRSKDSPLRFQPVSQQDRQKLGQSGQEVQRFRDVRQKLESNAAVRPAGALAKEPAPARMPLTRSPIAAKPVAELGANRVPPKVYEGPKPDLNVPAKARVAQSERQPQQHMVNRQPLDTPQPQRQPQAERATPQPQRQPQAERVAPQPRGNAPAAEPPTGSKQEQSKGKDKK